MAIYNQKPSYKKGCRRLFKVELKITAFL